jgi:hypothetical protein
MIAIGAKIETTRGIPYGHGHVLPLGSKGEVVRIGSDGWIVQFDGLELWCKDHELQLASKPSVKAFADQHAITGAALTVLAGVPGEDEDSSEFYIRLEGLGNKHYLSAPEGTTQEEFVADMVMWLRLTQKLFG